MKKVLFISAVIFGCLIGVVSVNASSIKVAPQKYETKLSPGQVLIGAVDVSNPSDTRQRYTVKVMGFRQINEEGELQFYEDDAIKSGIELDFTTFELGAQKVGRIFFSINSEKLPRSGIYAAVLVNTNPDQPTTATRLATSVGSGTLLILDNSIDSEEKGQIVNLRAKFWQFGSGLAANIDYRNEGGANSLAFYPQLSVKAVPWGKDLKQKGPLVFTGNQRRVELAKPGSYFGMLPLQVTDTKSGETTTKWVFAVTGYWIVIAPLILVLFILSAGIYYRRKIHDSESIY